ncbi:hypothetical protein [Polyangium fumosum]|uniref:Uncharacterized protein n=1 Tax=Polyangium fumosum TaxID=889272 RepID=A0A4U1IQD8_9BACT|nr:hypothetical protein [Polyangium fumosum]TKC96410.1 hypothetical protein E8A74_45715 [Polyangium fumosum]
MTVKKPEHWIEQTIAIARSFSGAQFSDADREQALAALDAMIEALQNIRNRLRALPSEEERRRVGNAADALEQFLDSMKARPDVAASLGLPQTKAPSLPRKREDIQTVVANLQDLSTDEIQQRLLDEREFSVSMLHSVARQMGLSVDRNVGRRDLVDQIVKLGFANRRGYRLLGGARQGGR